MMLDELAELLDRLGLEATEAEQRGDAAEATALRARIEAWRAWAQRLEAAGRDSIHDRIAAWMSDYEADRRRS